MILLVCAYDRMTDQELLEVKPDELRAASHDEAVNHLEQLAIRRGPDGRDLVERYIQLHRGT